MDDLSYAAGLIDGEGCVGVYRNSHLGSYQLRITVEMVQDEGLAVLRELFGGSMYEKPRKNPKWRPTRSWMVFGSTAETALKELLPHLRVKKSQAELALTADWSSFNSNTPLTDVEKQQRVFVHDEMKKLNKRGL